MSDSLQPHEPQHARPPCPSSTPGVYRNPCPSSWWHHPAISSSIIPFSSCPQPFPASGSFQMSQLFTSGGQNIGVSASTSALPRNTQDWSPLMDWLNLLAVHQVIKWFKTYPDSATRVLPWSVDSWMLMTPFQTNWLFWFSHSVMSDSLWPHGLQHTGPPCPSPSPRVYSTSCPLSWWCHPSPHPL